MDPVASFALAASILQVVDFSTRLLATGHQLYQNGSTIRNSEFMLVANDLSTLNDKIKAFARPDLSVAGPLTGENQALENLACELEDVAGEVTLVLHRIRLNGERTKFKSFTQAFLTMWSQNKIDETLTRLKDIRAEVQFHLLVLMLEKVDGVELKADASLHSLDDATKAIVGSILQGNTNLTNFVALQTSKFIERESAREAAAIVRHNEIRHENTDLSNKLDHLSQLLGQRAFASSDDESTLRYIKSLLDFPRKEDRYDIIRTAHKATFRWVFENPQGTQASWDNFEDWLRGNAGLYWITGKAGSGKSTLVKYLVQNIRFRRSLELWAGSQPIIVASYYFWNPGESLQKSQEGLFRTLLLKVLEEQPKLGPVLFPERYQPEANWTQFPTFHQLRRAFEKLTTQTEIPMRVVLVVDGLDEFEPTDASYTELADLFVEASRSPSIKALLSSRPLSAFEATFTDYPKLRLHELTRNDIEAYVNARLGSHQRIVQLTEGDPAGSKALMTEIVSASSGVFLWVKLVVDLLLEGFQNFDAVEDLRLKLRAIPRDLDQLFARMLRQIPPEYTAQSSRMFQIVRCNESPPFPATRYDPGRYRMTAKGLYFSELSLEKILEADITPTSRDEQYRIIEEVKGRLRSRCAGLIELSRSDPGNPEDIRYEEFIKGNDMSFEVAFLHRSVADWLQKKHVWVRILAQTAETSFDPHLSILQSLVMRLKGVSSDSREHWQLINASMYFARQAGCSTGQAQILILNELDRVADIHFKNPDFSPTPLKGQHWTSLCPSNWGTYDTFLSFAISHGLYLYVKSTIEASRGLPNKTGWPLLHYACYMDLSADFARLAIYPDIVKILLEHGADPNEEYKGYSPWQHALSDDTFFSLWGASASWLIVLKLLVHHGADPNAKFKELRKLQQRGVVPKSERKPNAREVIRYYARLSERLTDEQRAELLELANDLDGRSTGFEESSGNFPGQEGRTRAMNARGLQLAKVFAKEAASENVPKEVGTGQRPHRRARRYLKSLFRQHV